jgi:RNA polymerase sigma-70 factor (ECF subfamily)
VLKNLDRFDSRFRFSTWLFTIAKRLYVNSIQKLRPTYDSDVIDSQYGSFESVGGDAARLETIHNVRCVVDFALKGLAPQQREIILLFHQQNWPITDIAVFLKMPEGTVKSHLHRARKRMKKVIESSGMMSRQAEEAWS